MRDTAQQREQWSDQPLLAGWYWWRASDEHLSVIRRVFLNADGRLETSFGGEFTLTAKIGGEWQPVKPPNDDKGNT